MTETKEFCLLVSRAGSTRICKLTSQGLNFGYAPPNDSDLTLYDGALENIHGVIEYDEKAPITEGQNNRELPTKYRLRPRGPNIKIDDAELSLRTRVAVQLWTGNKIQVGNKYVLTVAEYQPGLINGDVLSLTNAKTVEGERTIFYLDQSPPFLSRSSQLFLPYLPEIYQPTATGSSAANYFLSNFLALFESVFIPLTWTVDNFDLFLHSDSAPAYFLPWLALWYGLPLCPAQLSEEQKRKLLRQTPHLLRFRGRLSGLCDLLEFYTGHRPRIEDWVTQEDSKKKDSKVTEGIEEAPISASDRIKFRVIFDTILEPSVKALALELIQRFKPAHAILDTQDGWH